VCAPVAPILDEPERFPEGSAAGHGIHKTGRRSSAARRSRSAASARPIPRTYVEPRQPQCAGLGRITWDRLFCASLALGITSTRAYLSDACRREPPPYRRHARPRMAGPGGPFRGVPLLSGSFHLV